MNGGGVIAASTYDSSATPNALYLLRASTGQVIRTFSTGGKYFGQPVFANGYLFGTNIGQGLRAYHLP
jgi:outer membrane protein assembly factor BamB